MTRLQTHPNAPSTVLSAHHLRIMADAPLTAAAERALARYIETRATRRTPGRVTMARVTSPAGASA